MTCKYGDRKNERIEEQCEVLWTKKENVYGDFTVRRKTNDAFGALRVIKLAMELLLYECV